MHERLAEANRSPQVAWKRSSPLSRWLRKQTAPYLLLLPFAIPFALFYAWPAIQTVTLSFDGRGLRVRPYVGLQNFEKLLSDRVFQTALVNTVAMAIVVVVVSTLLALGIALLAFHRARKWHIFFRAAFYLPVVASFVVLTVVWLNLYHPVNGILNQALAVFGIDRVLWLGETESAFWAVALVVISLSVGGPVIIYLAALGGIPTELLEAARIDGATRWQETRLVTVPLLKPATLFVVITGVISTSQIFVVVQLLTQGGPINSTETLVFRIYRTAFSFSEFGYAAAMSLVLLVLVIVFTILQLRLSGREITY